MMGKIFLILFSCGASMATSVTSEQNNGEKIGSDCIQNEAFQLGIIPPAYNAIPSFLLYQPNYNPYFLQHISHAQTYAATNKKRGPADFNFKVPTQDNCQLAFNQTGKAIINQNQITEEKTSIKGDLQ